MHAYIFKRTRNIVEVQTVLFFFKLFYAIARVLLLFFLLFFINATLLISACVCVLRSISIICVLSIRIYIQAAEA